MICSLLELLLFICFCDCFGWFKFTLRLHHIKNLLLGLLLHVSVSVLHMLQLLVGR
jgi:hypothetical protein